MDTTSLATTLAAHSRIERELGAGGLATVYRARDLEHDRDSTASLERARGATLD